MVLLTARHLQRYKDIALLLYKYGRSDLVKQSGLIDQLGPVEEDSKATDAGAAPECLARDLEALGPAFIKLGQLLSTRADLLPLPYLDALARLQDDVQPVPIEQVKAAIETELGAKLTQIFPEFDETPFATASLGQVHRATLRGGRQVVIKVQRPDIRRPLGEDLAALEELSTLLEEHTDFGRRFQLRRLVDSLRISILEELDYRHEAANAEALARNLTQYPSIVIPQPILDLTTEKVLTMEYIAGTKITDVSPAVLIELDRRAIADQLFAAYLHQVLIDGFFHADPHPGNLSLTPDRRIALMDFGMTVRVTPELRKALVRLLFAISEGNGEEAARLAIQHGQTLKGFDPGEFRRRIRKVVADNQNLPLEQMSAGRAIMHIQEAAGTTGLVLPREVMMLGKTLMNLDRVVMTLDPQFNPQQALHQHATEIMQQHSQQWMRLSNLYDSLLETTEFMQQLPHRANLLADMLTNNEFRVQVDAINETKLIRGLHKVANRITAGLVVAALIVGASLMMRLETEWKILGYPGLAFIFFMFAAIAGCFLLWKAMFKDEMDE